MDVYDLAYYYYDHDSDHDFIFDHIFNHLPLILLIILSLWFISLLIIIINGSHLKTKNSDNTCDTDNGTNTDDTDNTNDTNDDEKHITTSINKHMASIDLTLSLFLLFFVLLLFSI